jgi:hypothetical protein
MMEAMLLRNVCSYKSHTASELQKMAFFATTAEKISNLTTDIFIALP